jgi:transposase
MSRFIVVRIPPRVQPLRVSLAVSAAWRFLGGVPRRLVVDNLKAVVTRADRYAPTFARVFLEYAQYRGFVGDPTVPRHATGKPKVERGIPYVRQDFFRGEHFLDLADMQARVTVWCRCMSGI